MTSTKEKVYLQKLRTNIITVFGDEIQLDHEGDSKEDVKISRKRKRKRMEDDDAEYRPRTKPSMILRNKRRKRTKNKKATVDEKADDGLEDNNDMGSMIFSAKL